MSDRETTDDDGEGSWSSEDAAPGANPMVAAAARFAELPEVQAAEAEMTHLLNEIIRIVDLEVPPAVWTKKPDLQDSLREFATQYLHLFTNAPGISGMLPADFPFQVEEIHKHALCAASWPVEAVDLVEEYRRCVMEQRREWRSEHRELYGFAPLGRADDDTDDEDPQTIIRFLEEKSRNDESLIFKEDLCRCANSNDPCVVEQTQPEFSPRLSMDPERTFRNKGPVNFVPCLPKASVTKLLSSTIPRITFWKGSCLRAVLVNPLPIANCHRGYVCDFCNCYNVRVGWQVAADDDSRDATAFFKSSEGIDVCVACATFVLDKDSQELSKFLSSAPSVDDCLSKVLQLPPQVKVLALERPSVGNVCKLLFHPAKGGDHIHRSSSNGKAYASFTLGIAPRGAHLIAWSGMTPVPSDWRRLCQVQSTNQSGSHGAELGECPVCLEIMDIQQGDCLQTRCNHWFHVSCVRRLERTRNLHDEGLQCPLCRCNDPLGTLDEAPDVLIHSNKYNLTLELGELRDIANEQPLIVNIGVLVSVDGKFECSTDLGSCVKIVVPWTTV